MRETNEKGVTQGGLEMKSWNLEAISVLLIFLMNMAAECKLDAIWEKMKQYTCKGNRRDAGSLLTLIPIRRC